MKKLLQQCFLFYIVVVILGHNLGNSQVSVYRTIGPTLVVNGDRNSITDLNNLKQYMCASAANTLHPIISNEHKNW